MGGFMDLWREADNNEKGNSHICEILWRQMAFP